MTIGFANIIEQLERQKTAIETAIAALRDIEGTAPTTAARVKTAATKSEVPTGKRKKFSASSRRKMALAQKARWAKLKGEIEPAATPEAPKAKRKLSEAGRAAIVAATKKRWAAKRAAEKAAVAKTAAPKKVAVKKAAKKVGPVKKAVVKKAAPAPEISQAAG